ncbi:MAG: MFS transporter [Pseudomonadota bacterium]
MLAFAKRNFRWLAGGFLLTAFSSFGQTYFVSASVAEWQEAFALSQGQFGRLYMLATLASACCLPFVGRLVDVMPTHRLVALVVTSLAGAAVLAGFASSVAMLTVGIFLLRLLGQGMMTHIALTATGRWFSASRGRAVSLVVLGHQAGEATLPLSFAGLSLAFGYRAGWLAAAGMLLLIALPLASWAYWKPRTPLAEHADDPQPRFVGRNWTRAEVLGDPIFWVLLIGVLAPPFIGTTIFYHQDYLATLNGWAPQLFPSALIPMAITTVCVALLTGGIIDRVGAVRVLPLYLLPLACACFAMALSGPAWSLFVAMFLLGISYGVSSTLLGALWPEIYGVLNLGAIRSVIVSAMVLATAAGPGITGTLIDWGVDLPRQMNWLGGYCLVAVGAMSLASRYLKKREGNGASQRPGPVANRS